MRIAQVLNDFSDKYPIYKSLEFSVNNKSTPEKLHPLFVLTQYIIDKLISDGSRRIAVVVPDDGCNILPLIISKYFYNLQYEPDYAGSILDEIESGQHIRLGKAVVEFLEIDKEKNIIKFRTGRKNSTIVSCPVNGLHSLFEKTEGAITSYNIWYKESSSAALQIDSAENLTSRLKMKRTMLRKTMTLLSAKNDFKEFVDMLNINGCDFADVVTYGEIDLDSPDKFKLYNKGRLDCLPGISVSTKIEELYYLLKDNTMKDKIFAFFSTVDKFDEIMSNPDTLKKILKKEIPFVVFVPESGFESCPVLTDFGFDLWHWKPSTMKSDALMVDENCSVSSNEKSLFGKFSKKVNRAAISDFQILIAHDKCLKDLVYLIKTLSIEASNKENVLRQFVRRIWAFHSKISWLICPIEGKIKKNLEYEFDEIKMFWEEQKNFYIGQNIEVVMENILNNIQLLINENKTKKLLEIEEFFSKMNEQHKSILILVPNKYPYFAESYQYIDRLRGNCSIRLQHLADFYAEQKKIYKCVDYLVVTWFDKDEYIHIKQTYCYENLSFILYDYENKWREKFVKNFDECIPHERVLNSAERVAFSKNDIYDKPLDRIFTEDNEAYKEISNYNISSAIIRSTFGNSGVSEDSVDSIECIPVILSEEKIAYFYPSHDVIDVTYLSSGDSSRPSKKDANKLKKGDKILIRQSGKDIIREKADCLMSQKGESELRRKAESWAVLLNDYARNKSIHDVCIAINKLGGECTSQQVRYWLSGETIMPRDKEILIAIGAAASCESDLNEKSEKYLTEIDDIYESGRKVQSYHQSAGRWLTSELKNKALEIKKIANSSVPYGDVEGIGEVHIYTVEDILKKEIIDRVRINRIEELY